MVSSLTHSIWESGFIGFLISLTDSSWSSLIVWATKLSLVIRVLVANIVVQGGSLPPFKFLGFGILNSTMSLEFKLEVDGVLLYDEVEHLIDVLLAGMQMLWDTFIL